ncbi:MAG TPA: DUF1569 domain-containing protein [Bryobacteraceae bacterium]|nr:DUF1569 domain-containing protein [Bryobacteraceae bacterium]
MKKLSEPAIVTEVEARVRTLTPQSVRRWGRMTPHQAICHLSDSYLVGLGERPATAKAAPLAGLQRITALYLLPRWPHGVATMPEADQERGGTKPVEFAADQNALMELVRRFSSASKFGPHPIFGAMPVSDWMRWGYMHADHHLRQFGC